MTAVMTSNYYPKMITRGFDQSEDADSQNENNVIEKPVTVKPFAWRSQERIKCDIRQTKPGLLRTEAGGGQG